LDAWTITWARFAGSAVLLGLWMAARREGVPASVREAAVWRWLALAAAGLIGNYLLYLVGLNYTSPTVAQTVIQVAPLLLIIFGVFFFRERFSPLQTLGLAALAVGMLLFFNHRLPELARPAERWSFGVLLVAAGGVNWAIYGVGQKRLLQRLTSRQVLLVIYLTATVALLPVARLARFSNLDSAGWIAVSFGIVNTFVGYGAFGVALEYWNVSRVSAVVSVAPLFTLVAMRIGAASGWAWISPEALNALSVVGATLVVSGSMMSALGSRQTARIESPVHKEAISKLDA
jgi:drug/metabolite transporter (DMT)-like permease